MVALLAVSGSAPASAVEEEAVGTLLAAAASAAMARPAVALTGGGTELHGPRIHLRVDEGTRCGVAWRRGTELHGPRIHCG